LAKHELIELLPVVVSAIVGLALMVSLGFAIIFVSPSYTSFENLLAILLASRSFCYFLTGLIAGAWMNWRGAASGALAGTIIFSVELVVSLIAGTTHGLIYVPEFRMTLFITGFLMIGIGYAGGFVGERIRR